MSIYIYTSMYLCTSRALADAGHEGIALPAHILSDSMYLYMRIYIICTYVCNVMSCHVMSCHVMSCHVT